jgi:integrase
MPRKLNSKHQIRIRLQRRGQIYAEQRFPANTPQEVIERWKAHHKLSRIKGAGVVSIPTVRDYLPRFLQAVSQWKRREYSTVLKQRREIENHVCAFFGDWRLDEIDTSHILDWQASLIAGTKDQKALNPNTIKNIRAHFSAMFKTAIVERLVSFNPVAAVPGVAVHRRPYDFWDADESDRFLCHVMEKDFELFQVACFTLSTGLRPGEVRGLLRECLNFELGFVDVRRTWCTKENKLKERTKTGIARRVSVPPEVLKILSGKKGLDPKAAVFGGIWNSYGIRFLQPRAIEAGVKPIRFHDLRHSFASQLVMSGRSLLEVKELLGHMKLDSTMIYAHLTEQYKAGLTNVLTEGRQWAGLAQKARVVSIGSAMSVQ